MALDQVTVEYNANIDKLKSELNQAEQSFAKTDQAATASGKKIEEAYKRPAGILQKLQGQLKILQDAQQKAFHPASVISFQKKIDETKSKIAALTGQVQKTGPTMIDTFKNIGASVGIAFGVQQLIQFGKQLINLALDAEEVKTAFGNLNNPQLLDNLRDAVSGTVDDVTLMKQALKAENLGIPVEQLASAFAFAERRAGALGLTTEQVIDTIIQGIGSKSTRAFTALGIDALRVQDALKGMNAETAEVGDIAKAMGDIFSEELGKMGENIDSNSDKVARLNAQWKNFKTEAGGAILSTIAPVLDLTDKAGGLDVVIKGFINSMSGGMIGLAKVINLTTKSSATDFQFLGQVVAGLANQLKPLFDIPEEFQVDPFKNLPKSIAALEKELVGLKEAWSLTEDEGQRAALWIKITALSDQLTLATGGETEAMKASRAERDKQIEATEKYNKSITNAKKNLVEFFRLLPVMQGAADAVAKAGEAADDSEEQIQKRKSAFEMVIRQARAGLQLQQDTLADKIKLLEFEKEDELRRTEAEGNEKLLIIKKYNDLIKAEEEKVEQERIAQFIRTVDNLRSAAEAIVSIFTEAGAERLEDELDLIQKQRDAQLDSLDKQLENEKLTAKQREAILKQRSALEEDFAKRTEAAREEAAKKQLKFTIAGIVLNQSAAIASAIAGAITEGGGPLKGLAILAITLPLILAGFAQAMAAANAVELAEGEVNLKGPGSAKSDSIPARLSRGESVITAEGTSLDPDLLRAMNKGALAFDNYVQHTYVWPYMEAMIKANSKQESGRGMTFNDRNILKRLDTGNKLQIKSTQALINVLNRKESRRRSWN